MHEPFTQGFCEPCHILLVDHAENNKAYQATQRDIDICFECHEESGLGRSHPVDEDRIDPFAGGLFTCTSTCHDPHSAPFPNILKYQGGGSLCVRCHEEFK